MIVLIPIRICSLSQNINIVCDKNEFSVNKTINCILKGYTDKKINSIEAKLSSDNSLEISNIKKLNEWQGIEESFIEFYTDKDIMENFDIVSFTVSSNSTGTFKLYVNNIIFYDDSYNENNVFDFETSLIVTDEAGQTSNEKNINLQEINSVPDTKTGNKRNKYIVVIIFINLLFAISIIIYKFKKDKLEGKDDV